MLRTQARRSAERNDTATVSESPLCQTAHSTVPVPSSRDIDSLGRFLNGMNVGLLVTGAYGRMGYRNSAIAQILRDDPEQASIESALSRSTRTLTEIYKRGPPEVAMLQKTHAVALRTSTARYQICTVMLGASACVLLFRVAEIAARDPNVDAVRIELAQCFQLTARECEVAWLLARGESNADIARALAISPFTARRHTEHVLAKLGARSRAEAGVLVLRCLRGRFER
jgi:DNA-binding CsgD family transcriptional regulator